MKGNCGEFFGLLAHAQLRLSDSNVFSLDGKSAWAFVAELISTVSKLILNYIPQIESDISSIAV